MKIKQKLIRIKNAYGYSLHGLKIAYKEEQSFRDELILLAIYLPIIILLNISLVEKILIFASMLGVLVTEIINTALENIADEISQGQSIFAKRVKDLGSAAVFIAKANNIIIWLLILGKLFIY